jgi:excisionase family DNA binding protein
MNALPDSLMTKQEVADFLKVDEKTVYRLVQKGELHPFALSKRCLRFDPQDVLEWLNKIRS